MAKPKSKPQRSFFDADLFSDLLDPKTDGVYLTIQHVIAPLIKDEDYADMYSPLGRRPVSPRTLVLAILLQFLDALFYQTVHPWRTFLIAGLREASVFVWIGRW